MTGIILKRTPELKDQLEKIRLKLLKQTEPPKKPSQPRGRFLPGESRATVGADGFQPLQPRESYGRARVTGIHYGVNGQITERDLAKPQLSCRVNIGDEQVSPWELDCAQKTGLHKLCCQLKGAEYRAQFLIRIMTAEYVIWRLGPWTYYG